MHVFAAQEPLLRNIQPREQCKCLNRGAVERSRTSDLLITNQLLYQLSYNGTGRAVYDRSRR